LQGGRFWEVILHEISRQESLFLTDKSAVPNGTAQRMNSAFSV